MGIRREDCKITNIVRDTPGGTTYTVKLPGSKDAIPICFRRKKQGDGTERCTNVAGYGTKHIGTGACKFHGGNSGRPPVSGRYAVKTKVRLADKVEAYLNKSRTELLDLTRELAATRAMFDEFLESFPSTDDENYGIAFHRFTVVVGTLGTLVEKISKIDSRNTLTAAQVMYLRATMADIMLKYLPDVHVRERAIRELASRLGGDVSVEMRPSEISMSSHIIDA